MEVERKLSFHKRKCGPGAIRPRSAKTISGLIVLSIILGSDYSDFIRFEYNSRDGLDSSLKNIKTLWNEVIL